MQLLILQRATKIELTNDWTIPADSPYFSRIGTIPAGTILSMGNIKNGTAKTWRKQIEFKIPSNGCKTRPELNSVGFGVMIDDLKDFHFELYVKKPRVVKSLDAALKKIKTEIK